MHSYIVLTPKDPFSTCPWEQTSCLLSELWREFLVHLFSGSFWIPLCMALLIVLSQPPSALPPGFQTAACWSCGPAACRLRLEWICPLAEKDVPNFISRSRNYPAIFLHMLHSTTYSGPVDLFSLAKLKKIFSKPYNPNIFHVIYFSS